MFRSLTRSGSVRGSRARRVAGHSSLAASPSSFLKITPFASWGGGQSGVGSRAASSIVRKRFGDAAAAASPNRFRTMLDAARDPTPLWPPPQEAKGVIFKKDDGEAASDE